LVQIAGLMDFFCLFHGIYSINKTLWLDMGLKWWLEKGFWMGFNHMFVGW
jgi:hypothetical protein